MRILIDGNLTTNEPEIRFRCSICGCVFVASKYEYTIPDCYEALHDGVENKCKCPCCKAIVYNGTIIDQSKGL